MKSSKQVSLATVVLIFTLFTITFANRCTPGACYACATDGSSKWCTACGNGWAISGADKKTSCDIKITVKNCRSAPEKDSSNPDKCGQCQEGYFLTSPTVCTKLYLNKCDVPYKETATSKVTCRGCEGRFLRDDYSGCGDLQDYREEYPDNCKYGDTIAKSTCLVCDDGYIPSISGKSCINEIKTGCKMYHPNEPQMCMVCFQEMGYYAIDATLDGTNVYQTCAQFSKILNFGILGFVLVVATLAGFN